MTAEPAASGVASVSGDSVSGEGGAGSGGASTGHLITAAALAAVALGSAFQVALYLHHFGVTHRTDGFITAFAIYSLVVVVAQILRTTAVPLLVGSTPRLDAVAFAWSIISLATLTAVLGVGLAAPLAHAVAGSTGSAGRAVATTSLRVMAPAAALQIVAAGLAVEGATRGRLTAVSVAYMVSALAGLIAFFPLQHAASERVLAWTMLVSSTALVLAMLVGLGIPRPHRPHLRSLPRTASLVLRSTPLPACFVLMYPIALALAPPAAGGDVTLFGLAFTACSYLAGFTGQGLSMVDAVSLARIRPDDDVRRSAIAARAFRYSLLAAAPGLGVAILAGAPIVHALAVGTRTGAHSSFGTEVLLLAPWTVATLGLWATLPVVLSGATPGLERRLAVAVGGLIAAHVAAVLAGRALAGFNGVVVAMAVAPLVFVLVALRSVVSPAAVPMLRMTAAVGAIAAIAFGGLDLLARALIGAGVAGGLVAAVLGVVLYGAITAFAFRDVTARVLRLVRTAVPPRREPVI